MALSVYTPTGIVHETSVDFTKRVLAEPVHLVQYDASLPVLGVVVFDAGQYITLTASDTVSIRMDKKDGTFIYNPALGMSADGHTVYVQITPQMTANYGRFEPVLELLRGNGYGCSSPIPLFIDVNPVPEDEIESTSEYGTIVEIRNEVQKLKDETQEIIDSSVMAFDEAATRENIVSGESLSTIMGKVKKWFADLKEAAFCGVANNLVTPADTSGLVLDARKGKELKDLHDTNANAIASLNSSVERINISSDVIIPSSESGAGCIAYVVNRILYISYMSQSKTHDPDQLLCTLPSSVTPVHWWDAVCVKNKASGVVRFATDRSVKLWINPSSIADTGRIYFEATVPLL